MKKYIKMIIGFIILLIFVEKCTAINLVSSSIFKKSAYSNYKYLFEGVENKISEIVQISDSPYKTVAYDAVGNYFIVYGDDAICKINSQGVEEFLIEKQDGVSYANLGAFVFKDSMVYDLSQKGIRKTKLSKIIKAEGEQLESNGFLELLGYYYDKADTVIYANVDAFYTKNHEIYFKINEEWVGVYLPKNGTKGIYFYAGGEILTKYPEKYQRLLFLKNPVNNVYATRSSGSEHFSSSPDEVELTEEAKLEYPTDKKIDISFFQKETRFSEIVYTPIPLSFSGSAYFNLKIRDESYLFKEMGIKSCGFSFGIRHDISYYVLPKKYENKSEVSFLKVFPSSNKNETGSKGFYIVRPKK